MSTMSGEAIEGIEIRIAFLERANQDLSDVVFRHRQEIDSLRAQLGTLIARIDAAATQQEERPYSLEEEKPPHY
jgi:uncharacterized coiled-coil protein SlyX